MLESYSLMVIVMTAQFCQILSTPTPQFNNYNNYAQRPVLSSSIDQNVNLRRRMDSNNNSQNGQQCGETYCEYDDNYPAERIAMSKNTLKNYSLFFDDEGAFDEDTIGPRLGGDSPPEQGLCDSRIVTIFPKKAQNKYNEWKTIVNNDEYRQGIKIEECRNKDKQCTFHKLFPTGTISSCRQHYTIRSLIVSNPDGTISKDYFSIPSCCKCVLLDSRSFSAPITSRMGGRPKPDNSEMMFTFSP